MLLAVSAFAQTAEKSSPAPDSWQKMKECAAQAEKVMMDKAGTWENHVSPKYGRCFILRITNVPGEGAGKTYPQFVNQLIDAFERSELAQRVSETAVPPAPSDLLSCRIDHKPVDCDKAAAFIAEHMKN
jgi:hypothetical protein